VGRDHIPGGPEFDGFSVAEMFPKEVNGVIFGPPFAGKMYRMDRKVCKQPLKYPPSRH